jgi:prepilin-type N-terminal cleavage/methylation domain-containing protein/prepilin-type processing-associated H-X9-DG protein
VRKQGFTLIELLVVIAIIAILAAILFPVFARARAKAQQANCLSNVKQLTLGFLMYASDFDQKFPPAGNKYVFTGDVAPNWHTWDEMVYPYVKNAQIYLCPTDPTVTGPWNGGWTGGGTGNYNGFPSSYAYNCNVQGWNPMTNLAQFGNGGMPTEYYAFPAERMLISDSTANWTMYWVGSSESLVSNRHNEGSNMGFNDGHAKWMAKSAVPVFAWPGVNAASCHFWAGLDIPGA